MVWDLKYSNSITIKMCFFVILITNAATVYRQGKGSYSVPQQCIKWIKFKQINGIGRVIVHNLRPLSYSEKMNQDVFAIIFADTLISCPIHVCFFNIKLLKQRFLLPARLHPVYYGSGWGSGGLFLKSHLVVLEISDIPDHFWHCLVKWWTIPIILQTYPVAILSLMRTEKAPILMKSPAKWVVRLKSPW